MAYYLARFYFKPRNTEVSNFTVSPNTETSTFTATPNESIAKVTTNDCSLYFRFVD